ncbi:MAG TPA: PA14 domain-containing protein, partial [Abditibacteriaceae bacterium]
MIASLLLGCTVSRAAAQQVLFQDDFSSGSLNTNLWGLAGHGWVLQRTRMGATPTFGTEGTTTFTRLKLNTHSPDDSLYDPDVNDAHKSYLQGTEIFAKQMFKLGTGVEFEVRLRGNNIQPGLIFAAFLYHDHGSWPGSLRRDEIDFEFLGSQPRNQLWCHIWDDWNPAYKYDEGVHDLTTLPTVAGWDWAVWNTYKIRWTNTGVQCFVNNALVRDEKKILPDDHPMRLDFNIWASDSSWARAYSSSLQPTSSGANRTYSFDIDYVKVTSMAPPAGAVVGNGNGLSATYYSNADLTGNTVSRIDPRVNFNWDTYFPEPTLGQDTYSVRWTGQVQAQFNEAYTFYVTMNDGARLWLNGNLIIDRWQARTSAVEYSRAVTLKAGVKYNIRLEYFQNTGPSVVSLRWSSPSTPKQIIPQIQLYSVTPADTTR